MATVVLKKCDTYQEDLVKEKIREIFDSLGFLEKVNSNTSVFIKLNCVGPFPKEMAITTHPVVLKSVIQLLKEKTLKITVGDNPATRDINLVLKRCGLMDVILEENVKIFNPTVFTKITNPTFHIYSTFEVSKEMIDNDIIINIPKLKTHTLAYMTVAQKNFFGLIYGLNKSAWHVKASNPLEFGEAMNDLYGAFLHSYKNKTILNICDGIVGLEGEGPSSGGKPKSAKILLGSYDAVSLDRIACSIVKLDYRRLFINQIAGKRGYGISDIEKIELIGDEISTFDDVKFLSPKDSLSSIGLRIVKIKPIRNIILEHPVINKGLCIKCGECHKICPPKAMEFEKGKFPHLKQTKCIRCWCCQEVCPKNAISKSSRPLIGKLFLKQDQNDS